MEYDYSYDEDKHCYHVTPREVKSTGAKLYPNPQGNGLKPTNIIDKINKALEEKK